MVKNLIQQKEYEFNEFKKILFNKKRIRQNANKRIKIKNALKKHLSGKK